MEILKKLESKPEGCKAVAIANNVNDGFLNERGNSTQHTEAVIACGARTVNFSTQDFRDVVNDAAQILSAMCIDCPNRK